jgi:glycosyltransferase involved in cell wall biosynthesis
MIAIEGSPGARVVLVVSDGKRGPTATQMISFEQPFASARGASPVSVVFEQHYADAAEIEKAFADHSPGLLVLSRYTSDRGRDWIRLAREAGIPVIFHIDDDLLAVPASLGVAKFKAYNSPERLQALRDNIAGSDLLYVSTSELAKRFDAHGVGTPIVAGDVYCAVSRDQVGALVGPAGGPVIGYMGTAGHSADLAMIMPAVCELMGAIPSLQFEVFGTIKMPPELEPFGSRARHLPPVSDYAEFLPYLRSLGWWVGLAPLEDNAFNRCKADTKWVEYSMAGMAVVASDLPVYQRACADGAGILACSTSDWSDAVTRLLHDPRARQLMIETAQKKLRETYSHERLRDQVIAVFEQAWAMARS